MATDHDSIVRFLWYPTFHILYRGQEHVLFINVES